MSDGTKDYLDAPPTSLGPAADPAAGLMAGATPSSLRPPSQRGLVGDIWREVKHRWTFWLGATLVGLMTLIALFPALFALGRNPRACDLAFSREGPQAGHPFGYDIFGCDYYSNVIYGARPSIVVGVVVAFTTMVVGVAFGSLAGYFGGVTDTLLSRLADIFFAVPFMLGAIVILIALPDRNEVTVALAIAVLSWPVMARLMRSSVLSVRGQDYVVAAKALGATTPRLIGRHVLPNAIAPVITYTTVTIGTAISLEATLTFLGVGLQLPSISWGLQISNAQNYVLSSPHLLLFPGLFLSLTVLGFLLLGDVLAEALDPKLR
jgi:ABC-type dipeptide/oligopeptide/nickel transport system permease subunit